MCTIILQFYLTTTSRKITYCLVSEHSYALTNWNEPVIIGTSVANIKVTLFLLGYFMHSFRKVSIYLFSLILMTGCGDILEKLDDIKDRGGSSRKFETSNPVFKEFVDKFETEGKAYLNQPNFNIGDIPINFGDTEGTAVGVCFKYSNGKSEVIIDEDKWDALPSIREVLIYHELGHCRLNRGHDNSLFDNDVKLSILNEVLVSGFQYTRYRDGYVKELFTQDKSGLVTALEN